jgi:tetratricopeptide (TPR) repeat protein
VLNDGFCDMEAAEELLSTALTITPSDATALKMLGNIAWQSRGDAERAHQLLKRASDADPLNASIWCDLAEVTDSGLDNELAAVGLYARALSVDPQHCVARAETRRLVLTLRQRMAEGGEVAKIAGLVADAERTLLSSQGAQVDVHEGWVDEEADADQEADGGDSVEEFDEQIKALAEEAAKVLKAMQGKAPIQAGA